MTDYLAPRARRSGTTRLPAQAADQTGGTAHTPDGDAALAVTGTAPAVRAAGLTGGTLGPTARTPGPTVDVPRRASSRGLRSPSFVAGAVMVSSVVLVGLVAFFWTPYTIGTRGTGERLGGPSADFWLGTDKLGRDVLSQLMAGATNAVVVAVCSVAVAAVLGITLGVLAASTTRWVDVAVVNVVDLMIAFPTLLLAMLIVTVRGASLSSVIAAIGISGAAVIARITRINASRVLREDYVVAAAASGTGWWGTVRRHVLPNIAPTLLVQLMLLAGAAILAEASLSYLGLGPRPPYASWGRMLNEAQATIAAAPLAAILPGLLIAWTVLGLNLLGDGIRERSDPSLRGDR